MEGKGYKLGNPMAIIAIFVILVVFGGLTPATATPIGECLNRCARQCGSDAGCLASCTASCAAECYKECYDGCEWWNAPICYPSCTIGCTLPFKAEAETMKMRSCLGDCKKENNNNEKALIKLVSEAA